ncbi:DUF1573 domain-containing protein [Sporocytophaga myxococcoides]|uniref:DUF1573 domain-containing protein n=1 Tax=Sporocytophaga myxococcoides TaxID=153721 RepID=UPI0003FA7035|nr:DUF1573 domain-containing protein [Sporocytophaga myxococcoides]
MVRITVIFTFLIFLTFQLFAQTGVLQFEETTFDFGSINEEKGPVSHEFKFTNKGSAPLVVSEVRASCGCTTPAWTKEPVMPGQTGVIKAQFDPTNRPGAFNKSLTITANTEPATNVVFIKGTVIPKPKTPTDEFPDTLGSLRVTSRYLNLGGLTTKEPVVREFGIYNDGETPVTFQAAQSVPKHMKVSVEPATLQPKHKGVIKITYDAKAKNDFGYVNDNFTLVSNDKKGGRKNINVVATINEYFPPMNPEQLSQAPRLSFDKTVHDFGPVKAGSISETEFEFTNTGKQDLIIRKVKASCGCTAGTPEKTLLKPGEKSKIKVTFNSAGREGAETKTVTIYSNDPQGSNQTLTIKAKVSKE